jgi:nucleoid DNA-binding protein
MATLPELARAAGLDPVLCPHCGRRVQTLDAVDLMFSAILHKIRGGETVSIRQFGSFCLVHRVGRGLGAAAGSYPVIRFTAAAHAKAVIRG